MVCCCVNLIGCLLIETDSESELLPSLDDPLSESLEFELEPLLDCDEEFSDELESSECSLSGSGTLAMTLG